MLIKSVAGLIAAAALVLLAGCATPCAPGRLCAPAEPNTSALPPTHALAPPQPPVPALPAARGQPSHTIRIALLLPLQSDKLGEAAEAVRAGFMAAYQRQRAGFEVDLVATGDTPQDALDAYRQASRQDDLVVGPLARPAVDALAAGGELPRPTIALNHPTQEGALPAQLVVLGLSIEDEARQAAQWASSEHPTARALIIGGPAPWQERAAGAFDERWTQLGHSSHRVALAATGATTSAALEELRKRLQLDPPDLLFAALDAAQLREVRAALGTDLPCYAASPANPGRGAAAPELNGVRLLDLPWEVEDPPPGGYARRAGGSQAADMDRLYALGIDAFQVARAMALKPGVPFTLDGATGKLAVDGGRVGREEAAVVFRDGAFAPAR